MVSRRNFFSILIMMLVLLFMFQFSQVFKASGNHYGINQYAADQTASGADRWQDAGLSLEDLRLQNGDYVLLLGKEENALGNIVTQWCTYTKRNLIILPNTEDCNLSDDKLPEMILIDSEAIDFRTETGKLLEITKVGVPIVFCNLPGSVVIERQDRLRELLGISRVEASQTELDGVCLFSDFLLGGQAIYQVRQKEDEERQDFVLDVPWYVTGRGTKTYMLGIVTDDGVKREDYPSLIWRNTYRESPVFVVNGDYLSDLTGLGILDAIAYEMNSYQIYPIVNAHNVMVADYPGFAPENEEKIQELYGRGSQAVMRDVMWPGVSAMASRNKLKLTCFISPQYDYEDEVEPSAEEADFYLQQMNEIGAEAGKSLVYGEGAAFSEKLKRDQNFYRQMPQTYCYAASYVEGTISKELEKALAKDGGLQDVRTLSCRYREEYPLISYYTDQVTLQCATGDSQKYTYSMDLQARSLATALGYSNVVIDMHNVMWPQSKEDQWENYFDEVSSNISTYWNQFEVFTRTTLTESDKRVRTLLNLDYEQERRGDVIYLEVDNADGDAWFLLRTHGEDIARTENAEYEKIEKDAYLIHTLSDRVEIYLEQAEEVLQYLP